MEQYLTDDCRKICRRLAGDLWEDLYHDTLIKLHDSGKKDCDECYFYRAACSVWAEMQRVEISEERLRWEAPTNDQVRWLDGEIERIEGLSERHYFAAEVAGIVFDKGSCAAAAEELGINRSTATRRLKRFIDALDRD